MCYSEYRSKCCDDLIVNGGVGTGYVPVCLKCGMASYFLYAPGPVDSDGTIKPKKIYSKTLKIGKVEKAKPKWIF